MTRPQSRLLLLPAELEVPLPGGDKTKIKVLVVDRSSGNYGYSSCTIVLREPVPEGVTWSGSRLPGGIAEADTEDITVDLAAVEAGLLP